MALTNMGSWAGFAASGMDIFEEIYKQESVKIGKELRRSPLRHVTITGADGDSFLINGNRFQLINGIFATPLSDKADLVEIHSLVPEQGSLIQVLFLR
jgi:hypothetical protein